MPGLVGFVKKQNPDQAKSFLNKMASGLETGDRFKVELHYDQQFGLGRVSLGIVNPEAQPIWNEERSVCLVIEGEFYNDRELGQELTDLGYTVNLNNSAEIALHLYEHYGEQFAVRLNGAFVIAIWDGREQKLIVTNDRLGLQPIYYAETSDGFVFGSGVRALLADQSISREVDAAAIAQFLTFDHVLQDRTMLKAVKLLDQASVLTYQDRQLRISPYWSLQYVEEYSLIRVEDYLDELVHLMQQAITRQACREQPAGLLLSGGLDSRWLLAVLNDLECSEQLHTFTFGIPGCDDARFAKELSRSVGVKHHFYELNSTWLLDHAENAVRITDGLGNIVNMHALATLENESEVAKVIYKGFLGDAMFGYAIAPRFWADYDDETKIKAHWATHNDRRVIFFELDEQRSLFTDAFQQLVGDAVMDDYRAGMNESPSKQLANQRLFFDLRQRVPRMTIKGVEVVRDRAAVRLPFSDNDLIDFTTRIPPGYHYERYLVTEAFTRTYSQLSKIPCTPTNLPLAPCSRNIMLQGQQLVRWHMNRAGLGKLAGPQKRPYRDYNNWFRGVLRNWLEETLLSSQSLGRGYYNPDYIRNLVSEHMAGTNYAVQLGALMSIELWHRMFVD